jgi:FkbM family methyltransferase
MRHASSVEVHSLRMTLDLDEFIQKSMSENTYEPTQTAWARECLDPGDVFVDVGANFGWYTALAATLVGAEGHVYAFEPSPVAADCIARTIADNDMQNVTLTRAAVGSKIGTEHLLMPVGETLHSPSIFASDPTCIPLGVPVVSLDSFSEFARGRAIKLVKIDVEGYEPNVIKGLHGLAERGAIENLFCEFNTGWLRRGDTTAAQLFDLIVSYGFEPHKQTALQTFPEPDGRPYELQDIWFKRKNVRS